jgi:phage gpG-like protein
VKGADKALDAFLAQLRTAPNVLADISQGIGEELLGKVKEQHRTESGPYGERWAPKKKPDRRKVLSGRTSRLKGGWHLSRSSRGGFVIAPAVGYAAFHQSGTKRMPQRLLLPDGRGMPRDWADAGADVITEQLEQHFATGPKGGVSWLRHKIIGLNRRLSPQALLRKAVKAIASG